MTQRTTPIPFLDTNVLLRHLLQDHQDHSPRATAYIGRIERGELRAHTSDVVVFELVFNLERRFRERRSQIRDSMLALLELPGIVLPDKQRIQLAFELYLGHNISFPDAYHAVLMEQLQITEVISFDRDFDRVPGIARIEP